MPAFLPSRLVGTLTAAVLALTTFTAVPAYAEDDRRAARVAATVLGLAVVGSIIHNKNKKDDKKVHTEHRNVHSGTHRHGDLRHAHRGGSHAHNHGHVSRHKGVQHNHVSRNLLPAQCLRSFDTRGGKVHMFGRRCLERNYRAVHRLPGHCAINIRTHKGDHSGFQARCLRQNGFQLARH